MPWWLTSAAYPLLLLSIRPGRRVPRTCGCELFAEVNCVACHTPSLGDVRGIYSDLLLHDMGQSQPLAARTELMGPTRPKDQSRERRHTAALGASAYPGPLPARWSSTQLGTGRRSARWSGQVGGESFLWPLGSRAGPGRIVQRIGRAAAAAAPGVSRVRNGVPYRPRRAARARRPRSPATPKGSRARRTRMARNPSASAPPRGRQACPRPDPIAKNLEKMGKITVCSAVHQRSLARRPAPRRDVWPPPESQHSACGPTHREALCMGAGF